MVTPSRGSAAISPSVRTPHRARVAASGGSRSSTPSGTPASAARSRPGATTVTGTDALAEPDGSRLVHEATPDGLGIADEPLEPGGVNVDDSRSAILDPRRDGQSRLEQGMASGSDVLLDVRPRHEGWTAGGGFGLRHAR